ncbi:MAG: proline--tRNA ligase [Buchnera aphidicola (Eriosoma harunire)]
MRTSQYLLCTMKETPHKTETISHKLMLRAGLIRQISSGIYIWLPTGIQVINKLKNLIHQEMKKINGIEISMPIIQPAQLWHKSGRWNTYGNELFKLHDRKNHSFILSPTHEEIVTYLIKNEIHSYKQLPILVYQIQNKFRDEIRPQFGVIRSREFIMKDAYSFHLNPLSLHNMYKTMHATYTTIFKKLTLNFQSIQADPSSMGGTISHEFQSFVHINNNHIKCSITSHCSNKNFIKSNEINIKKYQSINKILINDFNNPIHLTTHQNDDIKPQNIERKIHFILIYNNKATNYTNQFIAVTHRDDFIINIDIIKNILSVDEPIQYANNQDYINFLNNFKSNIPEKINYILSIVDDSVIKSINNIKTIQFNKNIINIDQQWKKYLSTSKIMTISNRINQKFDYNLIDTSKIKKTIEIGHIFQLEQKYSMLINAKIQHQNGNRNFLYMGCYGIGITRLIAAIIEQNYDNKGIIWPNIIAPFIIAIIPINLHQSKQVQKESEILYQQLINHNINVIFDDRNENIGVKFADINLIGIPNQFIISEDNLKNNNIEYQKRGENKKLMIKKNQIMQFINDTCMK